MHNYKTGTKILLYFFYVLLLLFFMVPVVYVIALSLKNAEEVLQPVNLFNFWPKSFHFENFTTVMHMMPMGTYLVNSTKLVIFSVLGVLAIGFLSAYTLSRGKFKHKDSLLIGILFFQMISPIIISIPLYSYYAKLGMLNTFGGIALIYVALQLPFTTYQLKGTFDSIPVTLDEAASIDGCSRFGTLLKVIVPVALPGVASATIFASINAWAQFIIPFFLISDSKLYPVSVGILQAQGSYQEISTHIVSAASVIGLFPAVLLVIFLQKFILRALVVGSVKG
jgi:multiple sugar transport system permease protein